MNLSYTLTWNLSRSGQEFVRVNNSPPDYIAPSKKGVTDPPLLGGGIAKRGGELPVGSCSMCPVRKAVGQVAHFNLTPEAFLCRVFNFLPFVLSGSTEEPDLHTAIVSVR